jgi:hypothetical protein
MVGDDSELETAICGRQGGGGSVSAVRAVGRTRYSCTGLRRRECALIGEKTGAGTQEEVRDGVDVLEHGLVLYGSQGRSFFIASPFKYKVQYLNSRPKLTPHTRAHTQHTHTPKAQARSIAYIES